ncbi:MAG TPA: hypothetical protein VGN13_00655 [Solirubrobacteraceae bacterium]
MSDRLIYAALAELVRRHGHDAPAARSPAESLTRHEYRGFSQNGEDGVLAELLQRVGAGDGWFVEFGIESGLEGNCVFLADVLGWAGLFMEPEADAARALARKYAANPRVRTVEALVQPENVEALISDAGVPTDFDVLSIDVDGNDYWIWQALTSFSPHIVVIEYNAQWPLSARWVQPYDRERRWQGTDNYGASLGALRSLGTEKGYRFVHTELSGNNAFFVRSDLPGVLPDVDVVPLRAANHFLTGAAHPPHEAPAPAIIDLDADS